MYVHNKGLSEISHFQYITSIRRERKKNQLKKINWNNLSQRNEKRLVWSIKKINILQLRTICMMKLIWKKKLSITPFPYVLQCKLIICHSNWMNRWTLFVFYLYIVAQWNSMDVWNGIGINDSLKGYSYGVMNIRINLWRICPR